MPITNKLLLMSVFLADVFWTRSTVYYRVTGWGLARFTVRYLQTGEGIPFINRSVGKRTKKGGHPQQMPTTQILSEKKTRSRVVVSGVVVVFHV